jgi:NodT family efflux transporter outer membrane factor (OMF) lipoprotein
MRIGASQCGGRRGHWLAAFSLLAALALAQTGCVSYLKEWAHNGAKVGPNYAPPHVPLPEKWVDETHPRVRVGETNLAQWWDVFGDPALSKLIHQAYAQNLTVRQAGIQIMQAQIQKNIALSDLLPQAVSMNGGYVHGQVSRNGGAGVAGVSFGTAFAPSPSLSPPGSPTTPIAGLATPLTTAGTVTNGVPTIVSGTAAAGGGGTPAKGSRFFDSYGLTTSFAWELDFWGLFRRNLEAANASLDQSMRNYDELVVQLLANVATQYIELRTLQRRLQLARLNVALQEPLVARLEQQFKAGIATSRPAYFQLKSNLDNTRALIPPLEIALRQANNQLCNLLGMPVRDLVPELGDGMVPDPSEADKTIVHIPGPIDETVALSIPGDTLLRRPDVQALERSLRIQSAAVGIAIAEMFPHIGVNGNIGLSANRLNLLFDQQSWLGSIGPSLSWNILNFGRFRANIRFQNAQLEKQLLVYQQGVLNANQDAENALVAYLQSIEQAKRLQDSANAAVEVTRYYFGQLETGYLPPAGTSLSFYNQVFTAVNFRVNQQDAAAQAQGNIALNLVLLYRALGGGWQIRLKDGGACQTPPVPPIETLPVPAPSAGPVPPPSFPPIAAAPEGVVRRSLRVAAPVEESTWSDRTGPLRMGRPSTENR